MMKVPKNDAIKFHRASDLFIRVMELLPDEVRICTRSCGGFGGC